MHRANCNGATPQDNRIMGLSLPLDTTRGLSQAHRGLSLRSATQVTAHETAQ